MPNRADAPRPVTSIPEVERLNLPYDARYGPYQLRWALRRIEKLEQEVQEIRQHLARRRR